MRTRLAGPQPPVVLSICATIKTKKQGAAGRPSRTQGQRESSNDRKLKAKLTELKQLRGRVRPRLPRTRPATGVGGSLAHWAMGGPGTPFTVPHPVPYGPRDCSNRMCRNRFQVTIPAGQSFLLVGNPHLAFLDKVMSPFGSMTTPTEGPADIPPFYYSMAAAPTTSPDVGVVTPVPLNYQHNSFGSADYNSNGSGYYRFLGAEYTVREAGTLLNQGGSVMFVNGYEGKGLWGWHADTAGTGANYGADYSSLAMVPMSDQHTLKNSALILRQAPSQPAQQVFRDIPNSHSQVSRAAATANLQKVIPKTDVIPRSAYDYADMSWDTAVLVTPPDPTAGCTIVVTITCWYELHYIGVNAPPGEGEIVPLRLALNPDDKTVPADPVKAAAHENAINNIVSLHKRGVKVPSIYQDAQAALTAMGAGTALTYGQSMARGFKNEASAALRYLSRGASGLVEGGGVAMLEDAMPLLSLL